MESIDEFLLRRHYLDIHDLLGRGLSYYQISLLVKAGKLRKLNKQSYESLLFHGDPCDFFAVPAYAKKGVVALLSAAIYHELSDERLIDLCVALPRGARVPNPPAYPPMHFVSFSEERYLLGKMIVQDEDGNSFWIYDREKTVCDVFFYRNKIGFEAAMRVLRSYLRSRNRDIDKLLLYGDALGIGKTLRRVLEVLIYDESKWRAIGQR
ncbi:MAG: hypothetical protein PUJ43_02995 [Bacillales bacterium]|nr:hypothetical protein [Bacillales bacterium]MDY5919479.1 hypothetical protein [Candidatus Enteromonas sp.]